MKSVSMCVGLAFALSCGVAQSALAQDGLDVTMRVLDDVKDVDAVILEIEEAKDAPHGNPSKDAQGGQRRGGASGDEHRGERGDRDGHDDLDEGDTDHGDGKHEDHDVPSDQVGQ